MGFSDHVSKRSQSDKLPICEEVCELMHSIQLNAKAEGLVRN